MAGIQCASKREAEAEEMGKLEKHHSLGFIGLWI